jgi:hypothetical protein
MHKMKRFFNLLPLIFVFVLSGCSDKIMGYSVLLWSNQEYEIPSGSVLPVYIKSNISQVYVVGAPDGQKIELPLWQLTEPVKKSKIAKVLEVYESQASVYASVKVDGLPGRAEHVNTSKQVYRFRKGEILKILYKGKGTAPMTGGKPLEGDWYRFLTKTGVQGWCFSYNLNIYEAGLDLQPVDGTIQLEAEENDGVMDYVAENIWYPEYFKTMIASKNIDVNSLLPSYNFKIDTENKKVILNTSKIHEEWDYDGYSKVDDGEYELTGIPLRVIRKNSEFIVLRYTNESGKPEDLNFVILQDDLNEIISAEKERREELLLQFVENGPVYKSSVYGTITFNSDNSIKWTNFQSLIPEIIKAGAKNTGIAVINCSVKPSLAENYDGILTIRFDGLDSDTNFLYKFENNGLRLEDTSTAVFDGTQLITRSQSPVIMFFKAN